MGITCSFRVYKALNGNAAAAAKLLSDRHRSEVGFHPYQSFADSQRRGELLLADLGGTVVGYVRYHHREDHRTTLYEIVVESSRRGQGIGRRLVLALADEAREVGSRCIRLLCPVDLPANEFYGAMGFVRASQRSLPGKHRPLNEWRLVISPRRSLVFVGSVTASSRDLRLLIDLWEAEGPTLRPFTRCIVTPLFAEARTLQYVRYMHDHWGVEVVFDSGGFYVQQGKITYDSLFSRLLSFYQENPWAEKYVLPDFVPTSKNSEDEVTERVYVTAAESVRFLRRLPRELADRAVGVLQGHAAKDLVYCLDRYMASGINSVGFGSFDTRGVHSEINILTSRSAKRLDLVKQVLLESYISGRLEAIPDFHLFGVSSPNIIASFPDYLATSFDSSGWLRTAGFGNVYLPFRGRQNVSHGGSALLNGNGLSAASFYELCERTGHSCPFCKDFRRLQTDRFARMWHNALVFDEMTSSLNSRDQGGSL
jgi:GNAT superfamily N-acetyltransferase